MMISEYRVRKLKGNQSDTQPVVFLFDSDHPEIDGIYSYKFDSDFLRALKLVDRQNVTRSLVLRGDLLLDFLAYKPSRVASQDWTRRRSLDRQTRSSVTELSADIGLFKLLIGDFCDAFQSQWHSLDLVRLPELLLKWQTLYCISLPTFPVRHRTAIDEKLSRHPYYLGAVTPDLSNPLQHNLLVASLFRDAFIEKGAVFMAVGIEGYLEGDFYGADHFSSEGVVALSREEFSQRCPSVPSPAVLTARAMVTLTRLQNRQALNIHERLANELSSLEMSRSGAVPYDWDLKQLPNASDEVNVQARKLTDYLLNDAHEEGQSKARFFAQELSITNDDWRFLHGQFVDALSNAAFDDIRLDQHGIRFSALLPIQGRNGRTAVVNTAWIVRPKERASLVTAFPGPKGAAFDVDPANPSVVSQELKGAARWEAIFELAAEAGSRAAEICVPTPMKICGGELVMEGECGGAYVLVSDARKGFARWLKTNDHGRRDYRGGVSFYAKTSSQSVERATAYAEAFARVLLRNGIECSVSRYLT